MEDKEVKEKASKTISGSETVSGVKKKEVVPCVNLLEVVQNKIKCPKGQYNSFGKYSYRSLEDIYKASKDVLHEVQLSLVIEDDIVQVGSRFYIKATARLFDSNSYVVASAVGWAREEETKKGMDASQITGAASSYARKYALNALFCLDDTCDADTQDRNKNSENDSYCYNLSRLDKEKHKSAINWCITHNIDVVKQGEKMVIYTNQPINFFENIRE